MPPGRTWFLTTTPRGRRSPALAWSVTTAAGDTWYLSGLQRAALLWLTSRVGYGRHEATVTELGEAIGCSRGTASKILRRLRSLSLVAAPKPRRGRIGGFRFWLPRAAAVLADAARRRIRWPTRANDSTPTPFGGYLTREGMRRAWIAARSSGGGGPPTDAGPRRGPLSRSPRARGRPWPPRYADHRCGLDGRPVRLVRSRLRGQDGDLAAVYAARCPSCSTAIAASVVLVEPPSSGPVLAATIAADLARAGDALADLSALGVQLPHPARSTAAAGFVPGLRRRDQRERLMIDHMGYRRRPLVVPPLRPAHTGDDLELVEAAAWSEAIADLELVTRSRDLEAPTDGRSPD